MTVLGMVGDHPWDGWGGSFLLWVTILEIVCDHLGMVAKHPKDGG